ncbi:Hypothetical_protein [Hexamita inflata]|uniref:Hypothetical_protein n=1 Tax=Hexamita inflata TaxID=28002 RepID=A0AA86PVK2_9EUKA|nr:Hypothetical protein HINF_LOCUS32093 [Hexamita inflata]
MFRNNNKFCDKNCVKITHWKSEGVQKEGIKELSSKYLLQQLQKKWKMQIKYRDMEYTVPFCSMSQSQVWNTQNIEHEWAVQLFSSFQRKIKESLNKNQITIALLQISIIFALDQYTEVTGPKLPRKKRIYFYQQ